jgi:hypothetical protein
VPWTYTTCEGDGTVSWNRAKHHIGVAPIAGVLVALVAAITLTSVAAAGSDAGRQQVAIASKLYPQRTFVFTPLASGALKRDSGKASADGGNNGDATTFTFKGRRGTLVIRELSTEWVDVLNEEVHGVVPAVVITRWTVVRGTGQYAGVSGGGRSAQAGLGNVWYARQDGFLRSP